MRFWDAWATDDKTSRGACPPQCEAPAKARPSRQVALPRGQARGSSKTATEPAPRGSGSIFPSQHTPPHAILAFVSEASSTKHRPRPKGNYAGLPGLSKLKTNCGDDISIASRQEPRGAGREAGASQPGGKWHSEAGCTVGITELTFVTECLRLDTAEGDWCRVSAVGRQVQFLGAESYSVLASKLCHTLQHRDSLEEFDKIDDTPVAWVLPLDEAHTSIYASWNRSVLTLYLQDRDARVFRRIELSDDDCKRWIKTLCNSIC